MPDHTVNAIIKLRTEEPQGGTLQKGEVYIKINETTMNIYVGTKENDALEEIKPTKLVLQNDMFCPYMFGGFIGTTDGFSSPDSPNNENKTISNVNVSNVTMSGLSQMIIDTQSTAICGTGEPAGIQAEIGQLYFQFDSDSSELGEINGGDN